MNHEELFNMVLTSFYQNHHAWDISFVLYFALFLVTFYIVPLFYEFYSNNINFINNNNDKESKNLKEVLDQGAGGGQLGSDWVLGTGKYLGLPSMVGRSK